MNHHYIILAVVAVAAVVAVILQGRKKKPKKPACPWLIEQSINVPGVPFKHPDGWAIQIPHVDTESSVHYVTQACGQLTTATRIRMRYRVEMDEDTRIVPRRFPNALSKLTLYFQRGGDNWSAVGQYETYRWYAKFATEMPITAGEHVIEAGLDANWSAILTSSHMRNPNEFQAARNNAARVGFVLGGGDGAGHGVRATGPARLVILSFEVL